MPNLTSITTKNQITIPMEIVRSLDIAPKDKVMVEREGNFIKIKPLKKRSFLDLYGAMKTKKEIDFKKLRRRFEKETGKKAALL